LWLLCRLGGSRLRLAELRQLLVVPQERLDVRLVSLPRARAWPWQPVSAPAQPLEGEPPWAASAPIQIADSR
jgi:hypothetical protein